MLEIVLGLSAFSILVLLDIQRHLNRPDTAYMRVFLLLKAAESHANKDNQWLLEKFCSFRIVPRVGDTLDLQNGQYPEVTEVQIKADNTVEIWCDIEVAADLLDETAKTYTLAKGWLARGSERKEFHFLLNEDKLKSRQGFGLTKTSNKSVG